MDAKVVYQVVKVLPLEEQKLLLEMLQQKFSINTLDNKKIKRPVLTKEDAIQYLLKNVFTRK